MVDMGNMTFPPKPWSLSRIKALGKAIAAGGEEADGLAYVDVYQWYFDALPIIVRMVENMDLTGLDMTNVRISSRVKTVTTLRDKLRRMPDMQINRIHDIMGLRIAADMTLASQDGLVDRLCRLFGETNANVLDIRRSPHSGYRAVHVIVRVNGVFVEIQVRTLAGSMGELFRRDGRPVRARHPIWRRTGQGRFRLDDDIAGHFPRRRRIGGDGAGVVDHEDRRLSHARPGTIYERAADDRGIVEASTPG